MRPDDQNTDFDVAELITAARQGDEHSWRTLVHQYQPIINSVCRSYRLKSEEAADVSQTVWLKVTQCLGQLREARALPGWIKTTATRVASNVVRARKQLLYVENSIIETNDNVFGLATDDPVPDGRMLQAERRAAVQRGLATLSERHRALLTLLAADPPIPYKQISERLGVPVGSIGPTRERCLRKLAATTSVQALTSEPADLAITAAA